MCMLCIAIFLVCFFFNDTATTEIYTLSLHDALPISLLMTIGVMIGIASLTVIVAIGFGIKLKVLNRIANMGFGPESFSVYAGGGRLFFSRSKNTSMTLQDSEDLLALPTVRLVVPRQRKRMQIINKKEFTSTRVYGVTPDWQRARGWNIVDGVFLSDSDLDRKKKVVVLGATPARKIFKNKTLELVYSSKFVITRQSTAIEFANYFNKPIIFVISNEVRETDFMFDNIMILKSKYDGYILDLEKNVMNP